MRIPFVRIKLSWKLEIYWSGALWVLLSSPIEHFNNFLLLRLLNWIENLCFSIEFDIYWNSYRKWIPDWRIHWEDVYLNFPAPSDSYQTGASRQKLSLIVVKSHASSLQRDSGSWFEKCFWWLPIQIFMEEKHLERSQSITLSSVLRSNFYSIKLLACAEDSFAVNVSNEWRARRSSQIYSLFELQYRRKVFSRFSHEWITRTKVVADD